MIYCGEMEKIHNKPISDEEYTDEQKLEFVRNLFLYNKDFDSSLLYRWKKWADLYNEICSDESYPYFRIEIDCLKDLRSNPKFKKTLKAVKNITDHRVWNGKKAIELLKETERNWTYHATDCSYGMLDCAEKTIRSAINDTPGMDSVNLWEFIKVNWKKLLTRDLDNHMYLFLWGSICNMSDGEIIEELKKMDNNSLINGNKILLSYYTAPNSDEEIKKLEYIYNSQSNKLFHENGMENLLWSELMSNFEYYAKYVKDDIGRKDGPFPWRIEWRIRALKDTTIKRLWIEVRKWEEITIHYSRRFTKEGIEDLFKKSGCSITRFPTIDRDGVSIVLLDKEPTKKKPLIKTIRNATIAAIFPLLLYGAYKFYERHQEKKEIKKELTTGKYETTDYSSDTQISKEFFTACWLDKLDGKDRKQVNSDFNSYADNHKEDSISHEELISRYWRKYWLRLMEKYGAKRPYSFIMKQLINNTYYAGQWWYNIHEREQDSKTFKINRYDDPFEYKDSWKKYDILKVYIWNNNTPLYLATNKDTISAVYAFSTDCIKDIKDKSRLDKKVLQTNNNIKKNLVVHSKWGWIFNRDYYIVFSDWEWYVHDDSICVFEDFVYSDKYNIFEAHKIYLKWKEYYIKHGRTFSWKDILLASKSPDWPFTIATFNNISEDFLNAWSMWIKPWGSHKSFHGVTYK